MLFTTMNVDTSTLLCVRVSDNAILPKRATAKSAGYDLCSAYDYKINANDQYLCDTDLQLAIPDGCYGRVAPRSGLACKKITIGAGVIDSDYRGNVKILLQNWSNEEYQVRAGDRIAQLILEKISTPDVTEVESLQITSRGCGGFGSTGK